MMTFVPAPLPTYRTLHAWCNGDAMHAAAATKLAIRDKNTCPTVLPLQSCNYVDFTPRSETSAFDNFRKLLVREVKPVTLGRRNVSQDFAVTLMRAGYSVTDDLDIIAMQDFQKKFFETRQVEWEIYLEKNKSVKQGSLTDASYFDFISFAQMLTIHTVISKPAVIFEEQFQDASGTFRTRVVRRDPTGLPDSKAVYRAWQHMMGSRLFEAFSPSLLDKISSPSLSESVPIMELRHALCVIYDLFKQNGYCLDLQWKYENLQNNRPQAYLGHVEMIAPCTLWGNNTLRRRKCIPNDYDAFVINKAVQSWFNIDVEFKTEFSETSILRTWHVCKHDSARLQT